MAKPNWQANRHRGKSTGKLWQLESVCLTYMCVSVSVPGGESTICMNVTAMVGILRSELRESTRKRPKGKGICGVSYKNYGINTHFLYRRMTSWWYERRWQDWRWHGATSTALKMASRAYKAPEVRERVWMVWGLNLLNLIMPRLSPDGNVWVASSMR